MVPTPLVGTLCFFDNFQTEYASSLPSLPETLERTQREVDMHIALGASLLAVQGFAAREVGETYTYARHLCQYLEDPQRLFPVLRGLWNYAFVCAEYQTAHALGEQLLTLAQQSQDSARFCRKFSLTAL